MENKNVFLDWNKMILDFCAGINYGQTGLGVFGDFDLCKIKVNAHQVFVVWSRNNETKQREIRMIWFGL